MKNLMVLTVASMLLASGLDDALANNGQNFVARRYYCRSAERADTGDQTINADAASCPASRQAIQENVQGQGGDPCRHWDSSYWSTRSEEIQVSGCPRQ
jgi:hypothetical protein